MTWIALICRTTGNSEEITVSQLKPADSCKEKLGICGTFEQNSKIQFILVNHYPNNSLQTLSYGVLAGSSFPNRTMVSQEHGLNIINLQVDEVGTYILVIYYGDNQLSNSPFRFVVLPGTCPETSGRVRDVLGNCVCLPTYFEAVGTGSCISFQVFLPSLLVPLFILITVLIICIFRYSMKREREAASRWTIKESEIIYADPKEVLGTGSCGPVFKAEYRGTSVAVKRFSCKNENPNTSSKWMLGNIRSTRVEPSDIGRLSPTRSSSAGHKMIPETLPLRSSNSRSNAEKPRFTSGRFSRSMYSYGISEYTPEMLKPQTFDQLHEDVKRLVGLRHPFLTTVMGAIVVRKGSKREIHMVMELMELGSLWDLLRNEMYPIQASKALRFLRNVAQGMNFLHGAQPSCVHGDLKSANILIDCNFCAKLSDFGLSTNSPTSYWAAPECLTGRSPTMKSDVYSFGVVVYEVLSRRVPYDGEDWSLIIDDVRQGARRIPTVPGCSAEVSVIMNECLCHDPARRPPFSELNRRLDSLDEALMTSAAFAPANDVPRLKRKSTVMKLIRTTPDTLGNNSILIMRDLFPPAVAEALMKGEKVPPERKDAITMYFSDIVGFTTISASITPEKVNSLLDRLYDRLDLIAETLGVYKIETIGDAYLCAANVVVDQTATHALIMARFAVAAQEAARQTLIDEDDAARGSVRIRVGLSSGPCMASVVGHRNPKYTLFGDTINTASRMESSSVPGYIQCSQRTADLLRAQDPDRTVRLELRGRVRIKGKGDMVTYWILLPGQEAPIPSGEPA